MLVAEMAALTVGWLAGTCWEVVRERKKNRVTVTCMCRPARAEMAGQRSRLSSLFMSGEISLFTVPSHAAVMAKINPSDAQRAVFLRCAPLLHN